jgi:eukaryotic-like serine/threonine-protein kinase
MISDPGELASLNLSKFFRGAPDAPSRALPREPTYLDAVLPADLFISRPQTGPASSSLVTGSDVGLSVGSLSPHTAPGHRRPLTPEPDLPELGAIIDKYRIEGLVGVGGFAVVYRATHLLLHTPVALKMLRPSVLRKKPELAPLLCEEARVAARINHPNVVRVNDVTHTPHITYVVIEYVDGGSLADLLHQHRRISIGKALRIGLDVAEGLKAGLGAGIIHRDIKPANILLTSSGQAKVGDLGLARSHRAGTSSSDQGVRTIVGTPGYMAPEQTFDAEQIDFRADIYALGVTLYQAMIGEPVFPLKDRQKSIELHRTAPPPLPSERLPGFPRMVEAILLQMLAKRPEHRQSSYDVLQEQLRAAAAEF